MTWKTEDNRGTMYSNSIQLLPKSQVSMVSDEVWKYFSNRFPNINTPNTVVG